MNIAATYALIPLLPIFLIPLVVLCVIEWFAAHTKSVAPGLILPILSTLWTLSIGLNLLLNLAAADGMIRVLIFFLLCFLLPPVALWGIFLYRRRQLQQKDDVSKMNIQDL